MNRIMTKFIVILMVVLLSACTAPPKKDLALDRVRGELDDLKSNPELAGYAPLAVGEAERALRQAELASGDDLYRAYLVYMADRRIQIARTMAEREQHEQLLDELEKQRSDMLIKASKLEADQARRLAESRASEAEYARLEADLASQQITSLTRQLENLQLRETESGVVVTLGDVLFASGQTNLVEGGRCSLAEVVDLLQTEPDKKIRVEGHTDSLGDAETNLQLSEQRARAVLEALVSMGVSSERISALGMGEDFPIASNEDEDGRARNRRVDVILLDN